MAGGGDGAEGTGSPATVIRHRGSDPAADDGFRVDPHVKVLDEAVVERAKRRGLDALVYAPHFTRLPSIQHRAAVFSDDDLLVVPGREIFTGTWRNRRHLLAIGLEEPIPDFIDLESALAACGRQDATVLVPHPGFATVSLGRDAIQRHADAIHGIEIYNPKVTPGSNRRARRIAASIDAPPIASSYAHRRATIGEVWTTFERTPDDADGVVQAFSQGAHRTLHRRAGVRHGGRRLAEWGHLGWENSWEKIDRVLLSEMEATHPNHAAYGGQFDEACVY